MKVPLTTSEEGVPSPKFNSCPRASEGAALPSYGCADRVCVSSEAEGGAGTSLTGTSGSGSDRRPAMPSEEAAAVTVQFSVLTVPLWFCLSQNQTQQRAQYRFPHIPAGHARVSSESSSLRCCFGCGMDVGRSGELRPPST